MRVLAAIIVTITAVLGGGPERCASQLLARLQPATAKKVGSKFDPAPPTPTGERTDGPDPADDLSIADILVPAATAAPAGMRLQAVPSGFCGPRPSRG